MGFLSDIGRSGAGESLAKLPSVAVEFGKMQADASAQRVKTAIDLTQLGMEKERLALDRQKTESALAESAKRQRISDFQIQEMERQNAWGKSRFPLADHPRFLSLTPSQQKFTMDMATSQGQLDKDGMVTNYGLAEMVNTLETSTKMFDSFAKAGIEDKKKAYREKFNVYQEELAKGAKANPDKAAALKADMEMSYNDLQTSIGKADEGIKVVRENEKFQQSMQLLQTRIAGLIRVAKEKGTYTRKLQDDLTKAMKGAAATEQAIFRLNTAGGLSPEMQAMFPQVAEMMKSGNKDAAIAALEALKKRYNDQISALGGAQYYVKPGAEDDLVSEIQEYE